VLELGAGNEHFKHSQWQWNSGIWSLANCVVSAMLLNSCCSLNIFYAEKSVGGHVRKPITSSPFNRITFHLAGKCRRLQKINQWNFKLKFQTVAERTAKNFRGATLFCCTLYTFHIQQDPCGCRDTCSCKISLSGSWVFVLMTFCPISQW